MSAVPPKGDEHRHRRAPGGPMIFAVAYSAVGFSLYFSLGVVADYGLGLTPFLFLGAGLMFVLATLSFAEGGSMFVERGGSSNIARYAFNEFVSFVAGWALLIDFIVVVALAAVSAPHYLSPIWSGFADGKGEVLTAIAIVLGAALINVMGWWGFKRRRLLVALALGDVACAGPPHRRRYRGCVRPRSADEQSRSLFDAERGGRDLRVRDRDCRIRWDRGGV